MTWITFGITHSCLIYIGYLTLQLGTGSYMGLSSFSTRTKSLRGNNRFRNWLIKGSNIIFYIRRNLVFISAIEWIEEIVPNVTSAEFSGDSINNGFKVEGEIILYRLRTYSHFHYHDFHLRYWIKVMRFHLDFLLPYYRITWYHGWMFHDSTPLHHLPFEMKNEMLIWKKK
jgi:hypothetical protein